MKLEDLRFTNPPGFDGYLATRAILAAGGGRIHRVVNLVESYRAACQLGLADKAMEFEKQLREVLPMTHIFTGPGDRSGRRCKVVARHSPLITIQFEDGQIGACNMAQIERLPEASEGPRCEECGDRGAFTLAVVGGRSLCPGCRAEALFAGGLDPA